METGVAPGRPGRDRDRQVAGLPGARGPARHGAGPHGGRLHGHDRAAAPAHRARPAAAGRRAAPELLGRAPVFAILKGRRNYLCLHKVHGERADDPDDTLFDPRAASAIGPAGQAAARVGGGDRRPATGTSWCPAWTTGPGGRSRSARRECIGAQRCPFGSRVLRRARPRGGGRGRHRRDQPRAAGHRRDRELHRAARARRRGHRRGARSGRPGHPRGRAPSCPTPGSRRPPGGAASWSTRSWPAGCARRATALERDWPTSPAGRLDFLPETLGVSLATVRDAAAACAAAAARVRRRRAGHGPARGVAGGGRRAGRRVRARPRGCSRRSPPTSRPGRTSCGWTARRDDAAGRSRSGSRRWRWAGCSRSGCSAADGRADVGDADAGRLVRAAGPAVGPAAARRPTGSPDWSRRRRTGRSSGLAGVDRARRRLAVRPSAAAAILYVARHLPPPGRDGLPEAYLTELRELITAAGGRTLGPVLVDAGRPAGGRRAARAAAQAGFPLLCQGEDSTVAAGHQVRRRRADLPVRHPVAVAGRRRARPLAASSWSSTGSRSRARTTRSPRPASATVAARGGNGFMTVAAAQAALLLAQGAGPAAAHDRRQGRRRHPGPAAGHRPVRQLPARLAAAVLDHQRPGGRPRRPPPPGRLTLRFATASRISEHVVAGVRLGRERGALGRDRARAGRPGSPRTPGPARPGCSSRTARTPRPARGSAGRRGAGRRACRSARPSGAPRRR